MNLFDYKISDLQADPKVSAEEVRRAQVGEPAGKRLAYFLDDLGVLVEKDLRQIDTLNALEQTGLAVMELALRTKGLLKSAEGRTDVYLAGHAANAKSGFRHAISLLDQQEHDPNAWSEALEAIKNPMKFVKGIAEGMEGTGIKASLMPAPAPERSKPEPGPRMFTDGGDPAPAPAPPAPPAATVEPSAPPAPAPGAMSGRPIPALGMAEGQVIDVTPEEEEIEDEFDMWDEEERLNEFEQLLNKLENDGKEEGLKLKDWKKAQAAWQQLIDADPKDAYGALKFAVYYRPGKTCWDIPTQTEMDMVLGTEPEPANVAPLDRAAGEE